MPATGSFATDRLYPAGWGGKISNAQFLGPNHNDRTKIPLQLGEINIGNSVFPGTPITDLQFLPEPASQGKVRGGGRRNSAKPNPDGNPSIGTFDSYIAGSWRDISIAKHRVAERQL